jgi:sugar O-acyltransferase (sialic acid O-acetyltransferase NeuD family)
LKSLFIYGAGGHAAETLDLIQSINAVAPTWQVEGFLIDSAFQTAPDYLGCPVIGDYRHLKTCSNTAVVLAIGSGSTRRLLVDSIRQHMDFPCFPNLIHPGALVSRRATLGQGIQIGAQTVIQARTHIADHVIVNVACSISHDCIIDEFSTLAPGVRLAGNVTVASNVNLGIGAVAIPGVHLGQGSIVGAGSVVIRDVPAAVTVAGNPATLIRATG